MNEAGPSRVANDVVPLADRLRYMRIFRVALVATVVAFGVGAPAVLGLRTLAPLAPWTAAYLAASLAAEGAWRLIRGRALALFGATLIVDGVYLAWVSYATGGTSSPLRYLIVLHLIAVSLLASYRTGLKLALWHSMLLLVVYYAEQSQLLAAPVGGRALAGTEFQRVTAFMAVFWLVALATASLSAVNERELRRRRFDLEALARMAAALETASDSVTAAEMVVAHVADVFDAPRAVVLAAPDGAMRLLAGLGTSALVGTEVATTPDAVLHLVKMTRDTVLVRGLDPVADAGLAALLPGARNLSVVALTAETRSIGVLVTEHAQRGTARLERRALSMLERFASHAALSLRNAWLLEQVQRVAATDGLTGIANRRTFETALAREVFRASHKGEPMSLVMVDIDQFKQLNDAHGHQAGDHILAEVASLLASSCRDCDIPARYGGEEFAVILPGATVAQSLDTAERLRRLIAGATTTLPITASLGVATFPAHGPDAEALVRAADHALYVSKREGRNRVSAAGAAAAAAGATSADRATANSLG
jgi:diguanylate cyclase (GGDEF)-like protein